MNDDSDLGREARRQLLEGIPVRERRLELAGVSTLVLEGGDGPPLVLLHGPGEFAAAWLTVLPRLVRTHRVIVPDLPGHGASQITGDGLDADRVLRWLDELVEQTCPTTPTLVGRIVGGAIGAHFALARPDRLNGLVLVDTLGLTPFEPAPRFALAMRRYFAEPTSDSFERFMEFCAYDMDGARDSLGARWEPLVAYAVELARAPSVQAAVGGMLGVFANPIPPDRLDRIDVPTSLIWGREDLATPLAVAEAAATRHGWPLRVVDDAGDDPAFEQPEAFVEALRAALDAPVVASSPGA
jgi:pimeloyl-ACP methyl ester carboxylesterase